MKSSSPKVIHIIAALAAAALPSCGNGGQAPEPAGPRVDEPGRAVEARGEPGESQPKLGEPLRVSRSEAEAMEERLARVFDAAADLAGAHLRSGGLLVDFGTPARHKYTLGDWKSGWRGDFEEGDTTFSYVSGSAARVFFELGAGEAGGGRITIRGKAIGSGRGRIYLNGDHVGTASFERDGWGHASIPFESGLEEGKNEIILRFNGRRPGHDGKAAAAAIDYLRIATPKSRKGPSAASFDAPLVPSPAGGEPGIALAPGESLTYNLAVPEGAVLRGRLRARGVDASGEVSVMLVAPDGEEEEAARFEIGQKARTVVVDVSKLWGNVGAISVQATGAEAEMHGLGLYAEEPEETGAPGKLSAKNVVLVLIDTLRADHLHLYEEGTRVQTPYLDRLGAESVVFDRPMPQENWTKPSVATLLTGLYPETHRTKTEKNKVPASVVLASQHFKRLGFATAGFVANGYISGKFGFERGWDTWTNYVREGKPNRARFVADHSVAWLKSRPKDRPFFLYIHTIDPHVPYIPPNRYRALYDDEPYRGPVSPRNTAKLLEGIKTGKVKLSPRDRFRLEALYDGEISYHDDHLARVHDALEAEGLLDDTLIVVTSDHGEEFFEHGSVGHGHSMYEELLHVPLLVRLPGAKAGEGAVSAADVGLVDVLPTICAVLGVECPDGTEGRSLVPLLKGEELDGWPRVAFSDFLDGQRVARMGRYKLIYRGLSTTLFDLEGDPAETTDLSDSLPVVLAFMREALGAHEGRFVDTGEVVEREDRDAGKKAKPAKKKHASEDAEIDRETRKQLEALGYMGD